MAWEGLGKTFTPRVLIHGFLKRFAGKLCDPASEGLVRAFQNGDDPLWRF